LEASLSTGILIAAENRLRILASLLTLAFFVTLTASLEPSHAQDTPWKRRLRKGVVLNDSPEARPESRKGPLTADEMRRLGLRPRGAGLVDLSYWPEEPASPARVATSDLAKAMAQLCPATTQREKIDVSAFPFRREALARSGPNIYFAAAILNVFGQQCPHVDADGNGVVSLYAHLASYDVQVGDRIEAGERLGEVGHTGIRDSGAHLHFGLFQDGKVLDPHHRRR